MRLSMNETDPAYDPANGIRAKVLFDGEPVKGCMTADEEAGTIEVYLFDDAGRVVTNGDRAATEIRHGKVEIILPQGATW